MVAISLIAILALWVSRINFNNFTSSERVLILSQKIVSRIETVKNYAKNGYGIWSWLSTPDAWRISLSWSGLISEYSLDNRVTWNPFPSLSYEVQNSEDIVRFRCNNILAGIPENTVNSVSLEFSSTGSTIIGCNAPNFTELRIDVTYANENRYILFSTLNGILEVKKE